MVPSGPMMCLSLLTGYDGLEATLGVKDCVSGIA